GDEEIHREVVLENAYRLPERLPADAIVVDVGAHIGAYSLLALRRGAGRVWAYETDPENYQLCCKNLSLFGRRAVVRRQAVWSHYGRVGPAPSPEANGGWGVFFPDGEVVDAIPLDVILWGAPRHGDQAVEFLKLDCEMAEWPILFAARRL